MTSIWYGTTELPSVKPRETISSLSSSRRFILLPVGITTAPANAKILVISYPIPEEAPVTNTIFDFNDSCTGDGFIESKKKISTIYFH